ncbi:MAG: ribosome small subunit-dependent GTPase A [Oscillospiraceae bacterium]|nr:ribosome small subunit-dependent GTPase A [Oscillospiraceae bacterium]
MQCDGLILKGIGGFYYVEAAGETFECRARGIFRKEKITPLPGDRVTINAAENGAENTIEVIHERKSVIRRPPVANIDRIFIVVSVREPSPNLLLTDRMIAIAEDKGIEPAVVITKTDLGDPSYMAGAYRLAGIITLCMPDNADELRCELAGHISAFAGNSGVGKSTLLNRVDESLRIDTAEISKKLGRGRHTTRHVELYGTAGGYVADTPGFSSLEFLKDEFIPKENLQFCFREFLPYVGKCRFSTCAHVADSGCKIREAVGNGTIARSRHASYIALYNEAKAQERMYSQTT